jgi:opacity protein-like surface antigen
LSYRPNYTFKNNTTENFTEGSVSGTDTINSKYKVKSFTAMANIYYDILTINNITPYLNIGAGLAINKTKETETRDSDYGTAGTASTTTQVTTSKNSFAYKFGLGARYTLNQDFDFDIRYQYVDLGKVRANSTENTFLEKGKLRSQEIIAGIAYKF